MFLSEQSPQGSWWKFVPTNYKNIDVYTFWRGRGIENILVKRLPFCESGCMLFQGNDLMYEVEVAGPPGTLALYGNNGGNQSPFDTY